MGSLAAPRAFNPSGCTDQPKVVAVLDDYGPTDLVDSLTFHGGVDIAHQWIGMHLPIPPDPPAAGAAPPARPPAPKWPAPTPEMIARAKEVLLLTYIHPGLPPTFIVTGDHDGGVNPAEDAASRRPSTKPTSPTANTSSSAAAAATSPPEA